MPGDKGTGSSNRGGYIGKNDGSTPTRAYRAKHQSVSSSTNTIGTKMEYDDLYYNDFIFSSTKQTDNSIWGKSTGYYPKLLNVIGGTGSQPSYSTPASDPGVVEVILIHMWPRTYINRWQVL